MKNKSCFFIGNREIPEDIREKLTEVIEKHIVEYGVNTFTVGHYGNFDKLVMNVLKELKEHHSKIKLYLLLPYHPTLQKIEIPKYFDDTLYPEGMETIPKPYAIIHANRYMIQHSNYLITYCHHIGNTRNFVNYAQKREKKGLIKITQL